MGIAGGKWYFAKKVPHAFINLDDEELKLSPLTNVHSLFLDLNSLVHQSFRFYDFKIVTKSDGKDFYFAYFNLISRILSYVQPEKNILLAYDGVSPRCKHRAQLNRRLSNREGNTFSVYHLNNDQSIDKCAISPGSKFMDDLHRRTKFFLKKLLRHPKYKHCNIYLSGHRNPGEGETKIFRFIKEEIDPNERIVVYSEDSDIIFYGLINKIENLYVINYLNSSTCQLIHVQLIQNYLIEFFDPEKLKRCSTNRIIRDLIMIFLLNGNDYTPALTGFETRPNILDDLITNYRDYLEETLNKPIESIESTSIYLTEDNDLNIKNFKKFIDRISYLDTIRPALKKNFYNKFSRGFSQRKLSAEYLKALHWCIQLYQTNLLSWDFKYDFNVTPFLKDLRIDDNMNLYFGDAGRPLQPIHNLIYIIPTTSAAILPEQFEAVKEHLTNTNENLKEEPLYSKFYKKERFQFSHKDRAIDQEIKRINRSLDEKERILNKSFKPWTFEQIQNEL